MQNPYAVLGLTPDADGVVVRAAWKALIAKHHPDHAEDPTSDARAREINQAYAILGDPTRRAAFDRERGLRSGPISAIGVRQDVAPAALHSSAPRTRQRGWGRKLADIAFTLALVGAGVAAVTTVNWFDGAQQALAGGQKAPALVAPVNVIDVPRRIAAELAPPPAPAPAVASNLDQLSAVTAAAPQATTTEPEQFTLGTHYFKLLLHRSGRSAAVAYGARCTHRAIARMSSDVSDFCNGFLQALNHAVAPDRS